MTGGVKLSYEEMENNCNKLRNLADQFGSVSNDVSNVVGSFNGVWSGQAQATFEEDYTTLMSSMRSAIDAMQEITTLVQSYVNDMREVEAAYGGSGHVSIG